MAGTQKPRNTTTSEHEDAPRIPVESEEQPKADNTEKAPESEPVSVQELGSNTVGNQFEITLDVANVPKAGQIKDGPPEACLVEIPGLGQFQNGATHRIEGERLLHMAVHYGVGSNVQDMVLPQGVTIKKVEEGK